MPNISIKNNVENQSGKDPVQKRAFLTDYVNENFNKIFLVDGRFGRLVGLEEKGDFFFIFKIPEKSRYNSAKYDLIQYDTELIPITSMDVKIKQEIWMHMKQQDCKEEEEVLFGLENNVPRTISMYDIKDGFKHLDVVKKEIEKSELKKVKFKTYILPYLLAFLGSLTISASVYFFTKDMFGFFILLLLLSFLSSASIFIFHFIMKDNNPINKFYAENFIYISQDFVNTIKQVKGKTHGWSEGEISIEEYERKKEKFFKKYPH